ncbi:uncharacterized protein [Nicotiana sylvestris]|uniref:uncharacterized protein n=1 Tax=Nicotiana sylvestris TaxID=4096 RepID=UPI00388CCAA9
MNQVHPSGAQIQIDLSMWDAREGDKPNLTDLIYPDPDRKGCRNDKEKDSLVKENTESKNIVTLRLDELIGNLTDYELRRQTIKMDAPKKEKSMTLRISEGADLEEDEIAMITKDFKKYLMRGKGPSRGANNNKPRVPEKQTNKGCYKCRKTDHHIKNYPQWEVEWRKERAERRNRKKEHGESLDDDSENEDEDEQTFMVIGESDEESELSKECVILKATCKNLEIRASESDSKNAELKNQILELDTIVLEIRSENLKLKLGTGKKKADHTQLTLEENLGKIKDELYKRDEQIRVLKEDLSKGKRVNNIYIVDLSILSENELTCLNMLDNDSLLWHKRLGYASLSQLNKLFSKDLVIGLPNIKFKEDKFVRLV